MLGTLIVCASLAIVDGDTVKCMPSGQNLRLLGGGIVNELGIDTPEIGSHAKCTKERKLALLAKARLKSIIEGKKIRIEAMGVDKTPKHRPLVNLYLPDGREVGQILLKEGTARAWRSGFRNDWCSGQQGNGR
jgi:endonuclease YncB( thermonuclease family)